MASIVVGALKCSTRPSANETTPLLDELNQNPVTVVAWELAPSIGTTCAHVPLVAGPSEPESFEPASLPALVPALQEHTAPERMKRDTVVRDVMTNYLVLKPEPCGRSTQI
jgi:hypothetical protein